MLWREPAAMTIEHWTCGPGGCDRTPTAPFQFVKEDSGGTNPKVSVRDAKGLEWSVKFGAEEIPECFNSRFVTALGYLAEPTYCVARGKIENLGKLKVARFIVHRDGTFTKGRFELRNQKDLVFLPGRPWSWAGNPFVGTHELAGLKIVMMLLSNWDAKDAREGDDSNNSIFQVADEDNAPFLFYGVSDWGAALGRWGGSRRRDKSDCSGYTRDTPHFVKGIHQNTVEFGYIGKHEEDIKNGISIDDVRWLLPYLRRITPEEIREGLKAAGATERQTGCWSSAIESRIGQLENAARR